jgi:hypothetical protein
LNVIVAKQERESVREESIQKGDLSEMTNMVH